GAVYLFNDVADRDADKLHPLKRRRAIASGQVSVRAAIVTAGFLAVAALQAAIAISPRLGLVSGAYLVLLLTYSVALKHIVILDVLMIAIGFVLRAVAGAVAVDVP